MAGAAPAGGADGPGSVWNDVVEERVVVGGLSLLVVRPRDSESLIDEERFEREEFLPYWAELWPSARALAGVVSGLAEGASPPGAGTVAAGRERAGGERAGRERAGLTGLRAVELGCGLGLPGIAAAVRGACVLANDWAAEALQFAAENARRNAVELAVLECSWAEPAAIVASGPFDLVLASDVLYERANAPLLVELLPRLVAAGGEVLLADPGRPALEQFLEAVRGLGWCASDVAGEAVAGSPSRVRVLRLAPGS